MEDSSNDFSSKLDLLGEAVHERSTLQLWDFYAKLVSKLEGERAFVFAQVENLRVPAEDSHRIEWETKQRVTEVCDLESQLKAAEKQLLEQQEELVRIATETDRLRAEAPKWAADLERLREAVCPRVDGVRYTPGSQPEKIGRFVPNLPREGRPPFASASPAPAEFVSAGEQIPTTDSAQPAAGENTGPIVVEYMPHDREESAEEHLKDLRERLAEEQRGHYEARQSLKNLQQIEEEENKLMLTSLQQNLARVQKHRAHVQKCADDVLHWHTQLHAEHEELKVSGKAEVKQLHSCNEMLSRRLQTVATQNQLDMERTISKGKKLKEDASLAYVASMLQSRDITSRSKKEQHSESVRGIRNIDALERRLCFLRERYQAIANHRTAEFGALRDDVHKLQHAVRQCEKLATHCVSAGFHRGADAIEMPIASDVAAEALPALALGPAVRRLRKVLEKCERALGEERSQHNSVGLTSSAGTAVHAMGAGDSFNDAGMVGREPVLHQPSLQ